MLGLMLAGAVMGAQPAGVQAQSGSAMDLVNAVNAYRASVGLEPYSVDSTLMAQAQAHSEYQASIQDCTHQRADGSGPGSHGIAAENIACGPGMTVQSAIYSQWADSVHLATMLGPSTGLVGAGAVVAGDVVYYTLAVNRLSGAFVAPALAGPRNESGQAQDAPTQPAAAPGGFATSTPNSDGSIAHVLKYGETLVNIATTYGISVNDLISINRLDPNNPVYYEGQVLIIRNAFTPTPFITSTYTPRPPTRTPMPTRTPRPTRTATVFETPAPTETSTAEPLVKLPTLQDLGPARPVLAYAFIGISVVGLVTLLVTALPFRRKE
jgi:LysM repeat protein